jgi:hypothetical protein
VGPPIEAADAATMSDDATDEARPVTSVELLDAAVWREIGSDQPQPPAAFVSALSTLVGRLAARTFGEPGHRSTDHDVPGAWICREAL